MTEVVRIIKRTFDTLENRAGNAITDECVGTFIEGAGLSAHGNAAKWLAQQPPSGLYLAWDGNIYPRFTAVVEYANAARETSSLIAGSALMNCQNCTYWHRGGLLGYEHGRFGRNPDFVGEVVGATSDKSAVVCMTDDKSKMGLCLHPALGSDYTDNWLNRKLSEERTDGVFAGCDESRGSLMTGEDFGCVHFQHNAKVDAPSGARSAECGCLQAGGDE